jgi:glycosyltransferase involved in cell wall biosynthesis
MSDTLLFLAPAPPHPSGGGGALRMAQMLRFLGSRYRVEVIAPRLAGSEASAAWLKQYGVQMTLVTPASSRLRRWLRLGPYEVDARLEAAIHRRLGEGDVGAVLVQKMAMLPYLPKSALPKGVLPPVILDLWAYGLIGIRRALRHERGLGSRLRNLLRLIRFRFFNVRWPDAKAVLLVSRVDEQRCLEDHPGSPTVMVPNGVDCSAIVPAASPAHDASPILLFTGDMGFDPNIEAAERLARTVFPAIRSRFPAARLQLVGRNPGPRVQSLAGDGVEVTGGVPDMLPYLQQAAIYLAPLHSGAGTRTKLLEAFAAGLPVITTPTGLEGIEAEAGKELLLAADDAAMADAAVALLADDAKRQALGAAARELAEQRYDWQACFTPLQQILDPLFGRDKQS